MMRQTEEGSDAPAAATARGVESRKLRSRPAQHNSGAKYQKRNFKTVAASALAVADSVVPKLLPDGKRQRDEWLARNPRRSDEHIGSFCVNLKTGNWADFALAGARGGDLISLVAYLDCCSQADACDRLSAHVGGSTRAPMRIVQSLRDSTSSTRPWVAPVPKDAPPPPHAHPTHGEASATWRYRDANGLELFRVLRFDQKTGGKVVLPLSLRRTSKGLQWQFSSPPRPRPLYGLDRLAKDCTSTVVVTEGEKAADAAERLLPTLVATTSSGGANSAAQSDWSPLRDRAVVVWPDADSAGAGYAREVVRQAKNVGARSVDILQLADLVALRGADLAPGYDAADCEAEGIDRIALESMVTSSQSSRAQNNALGKKSKSGKQQAQTIAMGGRFEILDTKSSSGSAGVYWISTYIDQESGESTDGAPEWLCGPLRVVAAARNEIGEGWGRVLSFIDAEGCERTWTMPAAWAAGDGREMRRELLEQGLQITTDMRRRGRLLEYVMTSDPGRFARSASRTGWFGDAFLMPKGEVIGNSGPEQIVLLNSRASEGARLATAGTLEDWRRRVAEPCENHSRLALALSTAFAALVLGLTTLESGGLHYRGSSSIGKSTALAIAASVFGNPGGSSPYARTWRTTDNALESTAANHSGLLLVLDELAELAPEVAARTAYMLANGQGKGRSRRDGSAMSTQSWQMVFMSAGEVGLGDLIAQTGGRAMAGQEVRLLDLPADSGAGLGMLDRAPEGSTPSAFIDALRSGAVANHGHAARAFLDHVTSSVADVRLYLGDFVPKFAAELAGAESSGQVQRAAQRFALISAGGTLATNYGITGWQPEAAPEAVRRCFGDWLGARGTRGALEPATILRRVRRFLEQHGESRFSNFARGNRDNMPRTAQRCGWRKRIEGGGVEHWIFVESFRQEVLCGLDHREAAKILIACGALLPDSDGSPTRPERMPTGERMRVYRMITEKLWDTDP